MKKTATIIDLTSARKKREEHVQEQAQQPMLNEILEVLRTNLPNMKIEVTGVYPTPPSGPGTARKPGPKRGRKP